MAIERKGLAVLGLLAVVGLCVQGGRAQSAFQTTTTFVTPSDRVITTHLNGDGLPDAITFRTTGVIGPGQLELLLNTGTGFASYVTIGSIGYPIDVVNADVTADGEADLVVLAGTATTSVYVLRWLGASLYAPPQLVGTTPGSPSDLAVGDVDADGDPDIAVVDGSMGVTVLFNDGLGVFTIPQVLVASPLPITRIEVADATGDGTLDIVTGHTAPAMISLYAGVGGGGYAAPFGINAPIQTGLETTDVVVADLQGNGTPDVMATFRTPLVSGTFEMMHDPIPSGTGRVSHPVGLHPVRCLVSDLDGDLTPEVIVAHHVDGAGDVRVLHNLGGGWFAPPWTIPGVSGVLDIASADLDQDGVEDLLVLGIGGRLDCLMNVLPQTGHQRRGTGDAIDLSVVINGVAADAPGQDVHTAGQGDVVTFRYHSYGRRFVGAATALVAEIEPIDVAVYAGVHVGGRGTVVLVDGTTPNALGGPSEVMLPNGISHAFAVPASLSNVRILFQAFAVSSMARNGAFAASPAMELQL